MRSVFSREGILWRALNTLTDIFALSLMFLAGCIGIVTAGASLTALYDSVAHCVRYKEPGPYRRFVSTWRRELKQSVPLTLLWALIVFVYIYVRKLLTGFGSVDETAFAASAAWYLVGIIPLGTACWLWPILSRFNMDFGNLNGSAFRLCLGKLPRTIVIILIVLECADLCLRYIFPAAFLPAVAALLVSLFTEPVFASLGGGLKRDDEIENENSEENGEQET